MHRRCCCAVGVSGVTLCTVRDVNNTAGTHTPVEDPGAPGNCLACSLPSRHPRHATTPAPVRDRPLPIVRNDDPETSHEAAARYEPKRETAKGRVLALLRARRGEWIDAVEFTAPEVGGFAGTRRLRELRDRWPIETRRKPGSETTWQHRLPVEDS